MSKDYFSKEIQDSLKGAWDDPSNFAEDTAIPFMSYYTSMESVPHKSLRYRVGDFNFASHLAWWFPKGKSNLTVQITLDDLTNSSVIENTETGFKLQQPYGIELAHLPLDSGEKGIFVDKNWFKLPESDDHRSLTLVYSKGKDYRSSRKYNSFTLTPERGSAAPEGGKDRAQYEHRNVRERSSLIGWGAASAEVLNEHTLRIYLTDALGRDNVDFHNLVLQLEFSETLEDCQVGFNDIPNYFGEIAARRIDGETILRERFGA